MQVCLESDSHLKDKYHFHINWLKWVSSQQNLSSGFLTKLDSNQSYQLQRLDRIVKFRL